MNKPTIADVLHRAADEFLVVDYLESCMQKERYSCLAVESALFKYEQEGVLTMPEVVDLFSRIREGMEKMGVPTDSLEAFCSWCLDECVRYSKKIQAARYNWLKFAALIAEEQGV